MTMMDKWENRRNLDYNFNRRSAPQKLWGKIIMKSMRGHQWLKTSRFVRITYKNYWNARYNFKKGDVE